MTHMQRRGITKAIQAYLYAKESHRAPEQARALLPHSMDTQFSMARTLHRWMPCIALRSAPEVQSETRLITSLRVSASRDTFPAYAPHSSGASGFKGMLERVRGVVLTSLPLEPLRVEHFARVWIMRQASRSMASRTIICSSVKLWALIRPGIKAGQRGKIHCRVPHPLERGDRRPS